MKKKKLILSVIYICLLLAVFIEPILQPFPPKPEIIEAKFPVSVTYEEYGEFKYFEDVMYAEFNGFTFPNINVGRTAKWSSYFESNKNRTVEIKIVDFNVEDLNVGKLTSSASYTHVSEDNFEISMGFNVVSGELLLNASEFNNWYNGDVKPAYYLLDPIFRIYKNGLYDRGISLNEEEIYAIFGIKIIDKVLPTPIENSFK